MSLSSLLKKENLFLFLAFAFLSEIRPSIFLVQKFIQHIFKSVHSYFSVSKLKLVSFISSCSYGMISVKFKCFLLPVSALILDRVVDSVFGVSSLSFLNTIPGITVFYEWFESFKSLYASSDLPFFWSQVQRFFNDLFFYFSGFSDTVLPPAPSSRIAPVSSLAFVPGVFPPC